MNNQTVPEKPDLVVFIQIPTQCTKHTQTDCNVACKHTHTHTHKVHLHSLSANMLQPHQQTIQALHHKAQICTSGCTRSCVLALIKSHSKMCAHTYSGKYQHINLQTNYAKDNSETHVLESNVLCDVCEKVSWRELSLCGLFAALRGPWPCRQAYSQYATVLPSFCLFYTTGRPGSPWLSKAAQDKQN